MHCFRMVGMFVRTGDSVNLIACFAASALYKATVGFSSDKDSSELGLQHIGVYTNKKMRLGSELKSQLAEWTVSTF